MSSLTFEPLIPPALWITLAVMAGVLLAWYARSRPGSVPRRRWVGMIVLAGVSIAAVLCILLNPTWVEPIPPPAGKPVLTVLVDRSASMAVTDAPNGQARYAAAIEAADRVVKELDRRFDVRVSAFGDRPAAATLDELRAQPPDRQATDVTGALAAALSEDHPQGHAVFLLSDGIHNAPSGIAGLDEALRIAAAMNVPVYTSTIGGDTVLQDLDVTVVRPQDLAYVGQSVPVTAVVRQRGRLTDAADVALFQNGKKIAEQRTALPAAGTATVRFDVRQDEKGLFLYEVRVSPLEREATAANNAASLMLRIVDTPVRVLLLEGKPYWDGKFLIRTLAADPSLELDAIVRVTESRFLRRTLRLPPSAESAARGGTEESDESALPQEAAVASRIETSEMLAEPFEFLEGPDGLAACQVVVLGRDAEAFLNERILGRLRQWVSRDGGSLVCYRGSPVARANQELARLLPVRWTPAREARFRVRLTERGQEADWLAAATLSGGGAFDQLPSLATGAPSDQTKPLSVVLATSEKENGPAVVTWQPYGAGRVVAIEGAGMWRWAFLAPSYQQHDQVYTALWQSLLRWLISGVGLVPGQDVALRTDRITYTLGEPASAMLLMRDEQAGAKPPQVELIAGDGAAGEKFTPTPLGDEPGVYVVPFGTLPEGRYRAQVVDAAAAAGALTTAAFDVRPYFGEQLDVQARPDLMRHIAEKTSGAVVTGDAAGELSSAFEQHLAKSRPERVRRLTAWDRWWVLASVLLLWGTTWAFRRSSGLV